MFAFRKHETGHSDSIEVITDGPDRDNLWVTYGRNDKAVEIEVSMVGGIMDVERAMKLARAVTQGVALAHVASQEKYNGAIYRDGSKHS